MSASIPSTGRDPQAILDDIDAMRDRDADWRNGQVWSLVFNAGEELTNFTKQVYTSFFSENALNPSAFPSLRQLELEVIQMSAQLLGGDDEVVGNMTSGGTESILMAVKTAREWGLANKNLRHAMPEVVLPVSAHPAFAKAGHYFGLKMVYTPVGPDQRADVKAMARAINRRTVMVVGSAPAYPHGLVDPITDIATLAQRRKLLCHVDACVGGFMLPFVRDLGYDVPEFDFAVPGVTSMSADLHKYGYAAKPASVVLYRNAELRRHQYFAYTDWPGGIYASPTMTGTRPGGPIAAAWAVMQRLGFDGYRTIADKVMTTATTIREGVDAIPGLHIIGKPHMSILAVGSDIHDIYAIGDVMTERGWHLDRQQFPPSLHVTVNHAHLTSAQRFLDDLREATEQVADEQGAVTRLIARSQLAITRKFVGMLPKPIATRLTQFASARMGVGEGDGIPKRSAPMYGMMAALPNRGDLQEMVIDALDKLTR